MRRLSGRSWVAMGLLLGCGPTPSEVVGGQESTAGASTGAASTSGGTTRGASSSSGPGADGTGDATGVDPDITGSEGTTQGVQPGTSTGSDDATSNTSGLGSTTTGGEPGSTTTAGGASSSSTGTSPTCDQLYDQAPDYVLCMETETECHFNATTGGGNCSMMCAQYLGTCIDAFDNGTDCDILAGGEMDDCSTNRNNEICVCSK